MQEEQFNEKEIGEQILGVLYAFKGEANKQRLKNNICDYFDEGEDAKIRESLTAKVNIVLKALEQMSLITATEEYYQLVNNELLDLSGTKEGIFLEAVRKIQQEEKERVQKAQADIIRHPRTASAMPPPKQFPETEVEEFQTYLLKVLQTMSDRNFEYLVAELMRACGFEFEAGRGTADDGIDGEGYYTINELLRYKVIVQCKRYKDNTIGNKYIRDLRGAISTRADKGLFVTTSTYTREARREADLNPRIDLVDGADLVRLLWKHKVGIEQTATGEYYLVDDYYTDSGFRNRRK